MYVRACVTYKVFDWLTCINSLYNYLYISKNVYVCINTRFFKSNNNENVEGTQQKEIDLEYV